MRGASVGFRVNVAGKARSPEAGFAPDGNVEQRGPRPRGQSSPPSAPVSISDVETVREGHQSEVLQSLAEEFPAERCFTIVFYGRRGNLDLIAGSAEEAQCWVQGLRQLIEVATSMDQRERIDQYPSRGHRAALLPSPAQSLGVSPVSIGPGRAPSKRGRFGAPRCRLPLAVVLSLNTRPGFSHVDPGLVPEGRQEQGRAHEFQGGAAPAQDDERGHERGPCPAALPGTRSAPAGLGQAAQPPWGRASSLPSLLDPSQIWDGARGDPGAERAPPQAADKSESGTLEGEEFVLFYKALTEREEVLSLFQAFSEDGKKLTLLELVDFLRQEQLEDEGTEELAMELIDKYEPSETGESPELRPALGKGSAETPPAPPAPLFWVCFTSRGRLASLRVPALALAPTACPPKAAASGTPVAPRAPACCGVPPAAPFAPAPFPLGLPSPLLPSACSQGSPRAEC